MTGRILAIDVAVAVILAAVVLILAPGVAVAGLIGLVVVVVCAVSFVFSSRRQRSRSVRRPSRSRRGR
jgi:hypothetical protein